MPGGISNARKRRGRASWGDGRTITRRAGGIDWAGKIGRMALRRTAPSLTFASIQLLVAECTHVVRLVRFDAGRTGPGAAGQQDSAVRSEQAGQAERAG